jgi:hypothetical protein
MAEKIKYIACSLAFFIQAHAGISPWTARTCAALAGSGYHPKEP